MKISDIQIRLCRHKDPVMKDSEMRDGNKSDLEFLVITFETDEGLSASNFGFAQLPEVSGLGIDLDWDFIDNSTFEIK